MILIFPLALAITIVILWRARGRAGSEGRGCRWFWAWSAVGAALCFSFLTGFSIGLFVLPFAVFLLWLVLSASPRWAESIGLLEGVGFTLLLVAYLNWDYHPCTPGPVILKQGQSYSCGGFDPHPWLYTGLAVASAAAVAYGVVHRFTQAK
jgi:hypothetical protein